MRTAHTIATGLLGLSLALAAPLASTADAASYRDPQTRYRVVDVPGSDGLHLRSRPGSYSRVVANVPFDARRLVTTGGRRGQWIELTYEDANGRDVNGWANNQYLALDKRGETLDYHVAGLSRYDELNVRARAQESSRVVATLANNATGIHNCGECEDGWCPVEVRDARNRKITGYVRQDYLAVTRPFTPYPANDDGQADDDTGTLESSDNGYGNDTGSGYGSGNGSGYGYANNRRPRGSFWRWLRRHDRTVGY